MHLKQTSRMEIMSKLKIPPFLEIWFLWAKWIYDWLLQLSDYSQLFCFLCLITTLQNNWWKIKELVPPHLRKLQRFILWCFRRLRKMIHDDLKIDNFLGARLLLSSSYLICLFVFFYPFLQRFRMPSNRSNKQKHILQAVVTLARKLEPKRIIINTKA